MSEPDAPRLTLPALIAKIAGQLSHPDRAPDRAVLRRVNPKDPGNHVFWRFVTGDLRASLPNHGSEARFAAEQRWAVILSSLAEICSADLFQSKVNFGTACGKAGWSEIRFTRLLRAHGDALLGLVRPCAHFLVSKNQPVNWTGMAELITSDGQEYEDQVRNSLARYYYTQLRKNA